MRAVTTLLVGAYAQEAQQPPEVAKPSVPVEAQAAPAAAQEQAAPPAAQEKHNKGIPQMQIIDLSNPFQGIMNGLFGGGRQEGGNPFDAMMQNMMGAPLGGGGSHQVKRTRLPGGGMMTEIEFHIGSPRGGSQQNAQKFQGQMHTMNLPGHVVKSLSDIFPVHNNLFHEIKMPMGGLLGKNFDQLLMKPGEGRSLNPFTGKSGSIVDPMLQHFIKEADEQTPQELDLQSLLREVMHIDIGGEKPKAPADAHPCADEVTNYCSKAISRMQCLRKLPESQLSPSCLDTIKKTPAFSCANDMKDSGCDRSPAPLVCLRERYEDDPSKVSEDCVATLEATQEVLDMVKSAPINVKNAYEAQMGNGPNPPDSNLFMIFLLFITAIIVFVAFWTHRRTVADKLRMRKMRKHSIGPVEMNSDMGGNRSHMA